MTYLCTYDEFLPQGAPTSSAISNLVMKSFDEYMGAWCKVRNINYTRYSDDLTFSGDFDIKEVKYKVQNFIQRMGFEINVKKTQVLKQNNRQVITGIVVNKKIQVATIYRKKLRQEIYYIEKYGIHSHLKEINSKIDPKKYLLSFIGKINFVLNINSQDKIFRDKKKQIEGIYKELEI